MKYSVIILSLILLLSIFSTSIHADEIEEEDVIGSDEVELLEEEEIEDILEEEEILELEDITEEEKRALFRITHVTSGRGFVMKDDESDAEFFHGSWIVRKLIEKQSVDLNNEVIKKRKFGFVVIGVGKEKEKFRLKIQNSTEEKVEFLLKDKNDNTVGKMQIKPKRYERLTLWFGSLNLDSGAHAGQWEITAIARTKVIKPKIEKPSRWNIFAFNNRRKAIQKEQAQERLLQDDGLEEFTKIMANRDIKKIDRDHRTVKINRTKRFAERQGIAKAVNAKEEVDEDDDVDNDLED